MNEVIKKRRKELNITLEEIGNYVGVSKATVQRWESGEISSMRSERIEKLCEILKLEPWQVIGANRPVNRYDKIPVLGRVSAGLPISAQEDVLGYEEINTDTAAKGDYFALKIKGDSMEPRISNGDIVIVRKQCDVESGDTAVVLIGNEEAVCKRVIKHEGGIVLMSNNPKYSPMNFTAEEIEKKPVVILGKAVELRAKF